MEARDGMSGMARREEARQHLAVLAAMCIFALPFDLIIARASDLLFSGVLGGAYILIHPVPGLAVSVILTKELEVPPARIWVPAVLVLAGYLLSAFVEHASWYFSVRAALLATTSILVIYLVATNAFWKRWAEPAFGLGIAVWALLELALYASYVLDVVQTHTQIAQLSIGEAVMVLRSPGEQIADAYPFFSIGGNVNKTANIAVLSILFIWWVTRRGAIPLAVGVGACLLMDLLLVVTLSRGAIYVALGCAVLVVAAAMVRPQARTRAHAALVVSLLLPLVVCLMAPDLRPYLFDGATMTTRVSQWSSAVEEVERTTDMLFGYGPGRYGEVHFQTTDAGTHNLFLDIWAAGGVLALASFVSVLAICAGTAMRGLIRHWSDGKFVGLLGILAIVVLGFREYELVYLNSSAMGSVMLGWFIAWCMGDGRAERQALIQERRSHIKQTNAA